MVGLHVLIGIGEALVTMAALAFVRATRPDLPPGKLRDARMAPGTRYLRRTAT